MPRDQIALQRMLDTIRSGFERFGFLPIETPVFEATDILLTKSGGETEKQVYFVQSTGALEAGKKPELALRFDLTVPLARYVAEHENDLAFPFRRYQIQRVYRGERNQRGRFREFYQCDIDVIGKDTLPLAYDAEMPAVIYNVFTALDFGPFTIRINNRKLLNGLMTGLGVTDPARRSAVFREVDKREKVGDAPVLAALAGPDIGLSPEAIATLMKFLDLAGGAKATAEAPAAVPDARGHNGKVLDELAALQVSDPLFATGVSELKEVLAAMAAFGVPESRVRIDLSIARGLDYYTGTIYETVLDAYPQIGSVCSGGRYDDLASAYTRSKLPGVGISIGATRLFFQLKEAGLIKTQDSTCKVYVAQMDAELSTDCRALAAELRKAGINTELAAEPGKLPKQYKYADRAGIRFVALIGGNEKAKGIVKLKDLRAPQGTPEREIPRGDLAAALNTVL